MYAFKGQRTSQRGAALLTAMLITSLATVAAVAMTSRQQLDIRRTYNILHNEQAYLYSLAGEEFVKQVLARDAANSQVDTQKEDWAAPSSTFSIEEGVISGNMEDLQGRFNLNNLIDQQGKASIIDVERFERLLDAASLDKSLALAVLDWLDSDENVSLPDGAEDGEYLNLEYPYRAANRQMNSTTELLRVKGFDSDKYKELEKFIWAFPVRTDINVNTAPAEVLMMLTPGLTKSDIDSLVAGRATWENKSGVEYANVNDFLRDAAFAGTNITAGGLSVTSNYFLLNSDVEIGRAHTQLQSILQRNSTGQIEVVFRSHGGL